MTISKQLESEILQFLESYWNKYIEGDIATWSSYIADDYRNIGTNEEEVWQNKKEIIAYSLSMIDQITGNLILKNKKTQIYALDPYVLAHEFADMFIKVENEWVFYAKLRLSSIMQKSVNGWLMLHQHGSFPDAKTDNGEFLAFENISRENSELRDAIKRRTAELEIKNRELEIEAALDRVRARSMAMHKSEELAETAYLLFQEFRSLENTSGQASIGIMNEAEGNMELWLTVHGNQMNRSLDVPLDEPIVIQKLYKGWKAGERSMVIDLNKKDLEEYNKFRNSLSEVNFKAKEVENRRVIQVAFFSHGIISLASPEPNSDSSIHLLSRFANVFEHNYRRFLDLQKAEAQAREAQIELALEKVRARTMAMHKSDELHDVAKVLFQQLRDFGGDLWGSGIGLCTSKSEEDSFWFVNEKGILPTVSIPHTEDPTHRKLFEGWQNNESLVVDTRDGKELTSHYTYMLSLPSVKGFFQGILDAGLSFPTWQRWHAANFSNGYLLLITTSPYAHEELLVRFAKVFEQAYIRFLDLQKAEVQAREAQIEAALEKVRSRSLSMHKSEELGEIITVVVEKLKELDFYVDDGIALITFTPGTKDLTEWMTNPGFTAATNFFIQHFDNPVLNNMWSAIENGEEFVFKRFTSEDSKSFHEHIFKYSDFKDIALEIKDYCLAASNYATSTALQKNTAIFINDYSGKDLTLDEISILKRFARVFEQAYIRFMDIKKSEEQAREAQIEAALEKVRSRSLAMHRSNELNEVVAILFEKLKELQIPATAVGLGISIEGSKDLDAYVCGENEDGLVITNYRLPFFDNIISKDLINTLEKQLDYFVGKYSKEEKNSFYKYLFEHSAIKDVPDDIKNMIFESPTYTISMVAVKNTVFNINDFEGNVLAENEVAIIKRFAKVFEQAYIRFMDIKKSEEQAREAQIEAALERVRSQSMGMQTSKDLSHVTTAMFEQLRIMGGELYAAGIVFCDKHEGHVEQWHSLPEAGMLSPFIVPIDLDYIHQYRYDQWKKGVELFSVEIPEDFIALHFDTLFQLPSVQVVLEDFVSKNTPMPQIPSWEIDYGASFKHGYILISALKPLEDTTILPRFAKVFEQTYTRYLDLQRAEEQAREAEIELALERVRSQAMAMQKSSDLLDIVVTMRNEFTRLGHEAHYFWHMMWLPEKYEKAMTSGDGTKIGFVMELPRHIHGDIPLLAKWEKSKKPTVVYAMNIEEALDYIHKMVSLGDFKNIDPQAPNDDDIRHIGGLTFVMARTTHGEIGFSLPGVVEQPPKEDVDILIRFAGAFDIAHRRFLDLQKSEAQSREVEIELALEKVRSRSMGMQKSDELHEVIKIVFEQLKHLKIKLDHAGFVVDYILKGDWHFWIADEQDIPAKISHPYFESVWANQFNDAKEKGADFFTTNLNFEEKNKFYEELLSHVPDVPETSKEFYLTCPGLAATTVLFDNVSLYIENFAGTPYSEEENKILMRFGRVFRQTYTRFLDLEKAEAQARESTIEAALEKVRSRSLAMHKSNELHEVVSVVSEKLKDLGIVVEGTVICIPDEATKGIKFWTLMADYKFLMSVSVPYTDHPILNDFWLAKKEGVDYYTKTWSVESKNEFWKWSFEHSDFAKLPPERKQWLLDQKGYAWSVALAKNSCIIIPNHHGEILLEKEGTILVRFANVFEQAYIRFLDLQKAEAQARESEIELALERVRARTMAMQNSDELTEASHLLDQQVRALGIKTWGCAFNIYRENDSLEWFGNEAGVLPTYTIPREGIFKEYYDLGLSGESLVIKEFKGEECIAHYEYMSTLPVIGDVLRQLKETNGSFPDFQIDHVVYFKYGYLLFITIDQVPDSHEIFKRFAKVFEQTYTRFLDLQKAEEQTREGQIELGLERVRARAMAMQHSDELKELIGTVYAELTKLNLSLDRCLIWIMNDEDHSTKLWMAGVEGIPTSFYVPYHEHPPYLAVVKGWKERNTKWAFDLEGKIKKDWDEFVFSNTDMKHLPEPVKKGMQASQRAIMSGSFQKFGCLQTAGPAPLTEEQYEVLNRFAKVFDSTYTRFNDLQKAEAQAREAKIEMALEKIRSRTMAMQHSDELPEAANLLFLEVQALGIPAWSAGYNILSEDKKSCSCIMSSEGLLQKPFKLHLTGENSFIEMYEFLKGEENFMVQELGGKELEQHYGYMKSFPELKDTFQHVIDSGLSLPTYQINHLIKYTQGFLLFITYEKVTDAHDIFQRFAKVFEQTYTRFLDLQRAEAQAKEAQIETSLERVRSRAMAMHSSAELLDAGSVLYQELKKLGIESVSSGYVLVDNEKHIDWNYMSSPADGSILPVPVGIPNDQTDNMIAIHKSWNAQKPYNLIELSPGQTIIHQTFIAEKSLNFPLTAKQLIEKSPEKLKLSTFNFKQGYLLIVGVHNLIEEQVEMMLRFTKVFELTYRRYLDLEQAEEQTNKANIEVALERVRARALAMQEPEELIEVAEVLRHEMGLLGIEELETASIYINDPNSNKTECWYALKDVRENESKLVSDHFDLDLSETWVGREMVKFYQSDDIKTDIVMQGKNRVEWIRYCEEKSVPFRGYYGEEIPDRTYHLYKFSDGAVGAASAADISDESWELLRRAASVFSLAYSRFKDLTQSREDLVKLKVEKQRAEEALADLKAAQSQLVQSEKMASLGELTAGIAHEIQNPLNFVNNFSEVSAEMIDEMREELTQDHREDALEIAADIKRNLEKILHHGKRADDIVKGMLQHSRTGTGVSEPTDINALCDEYLRLAYHGLRAKDKSFNAKMETDFDDSIKKVKVVPQDMGRVVLNLITNAFYTISEKKKSGLENYEPTVTITTRKVMPPDGKTTIEIAIQDNGNGIPPSVLEKIFQPFFTTKPTGQGTGLGLSMTYDIVKAHGGELKVETKEGEGTKFIILLAV